jgi:uncharacterized protein YecE (DUF72 family)
MMLDSIVNVQPAARHVDCLSVRRWACLVPLVLAAFVYVRFHGASGTYNGSYSDERLEGWADWLNGQRAAGVDVYAYFNNDVGGHAPRNALTLRRFLEERV